MSIPTPTPAPVAAVESPASSTPASPVGHAGTRVLVAEREAWQGNGFVAVAVVLALAGAGVWALGSTDVPTAGKVLAGLALFAAVIIAVSISVISPGQANVVQLFGRYLGTARRTGLIWLVPFTTRRTVSVRVRNFETARLKVNDADGNPVEIACIVVWQIADTAQSTFAVDNAVGFVSVQAEAALRHVARSYPYDGPETVESLRASTDIISEQLAREVAERVTVAGVEVIEVRISHLAYAPEIAQAMLQRQQASAVVAARSRIVEGAVGMVQMALAELARQGVVDLDEERRAAMVSNLLVVLCGEARPTPVVNAGTLYG
ncbi:MAG TPA: SPFH domain-containing protein [Kineosporiaceae bacterium]